MIDEVFIGQEKVFDAFTFFSFDMLHTSFLSLLSILLIESKLKIESSIRNRNRSAFLRKYLQNQRTFMSLSNISSHTNIHSKFVSSVLKEVRTYAWKQIKQLGKDQWPRSAIDRIVLSSWNIFLVIHSQFSLDFISLGESCTKK